MVASNTGSNHFEIDDLGSKVKVTVTENVSKIDEKNAKNSTINIFEKKNTLLFDRTFHCRHFDTKYVHIVKKYSGIFAIKEKSKSASD